MAGLTSSEPKLLFPGLAGFYAAVSDLWYPLIRADGRRLLYLRARLGQVDVGARGGRRLDGQERIRAGSFFRLLPLCCWKPSAPFASIARPVHPLFRRGACHRDGDYHIHRAMAERLWRAWNCLSSGASSSLPSRCAAAGPTRSTASSARNYNLSPPTNLLGETTMANSSHRLLSCTDGIATGMGDILLLVARILIALCLPDDGDDRRPAVAYLKSINFIVARCHEHGRAHRRMDHRYFADPRPRHALWRAARASSSW